MSFYDIKDKDERDRTIEEYLATVKRIKKHNMDERISDLRREADMQEMFKPVLESNAEMANEITQDLVPIKQELETLNETIRNRNLLNRMQMGSPRKLPDTPLGRPLLSLPKMLQDLAETPAAVPRPRPTPERYGHVAAKYLKNALAGGNDITTGIRYEGNNMMIGDKPVQVQGNDLEIGDDIYKGTPGLWDLITQKSPKEFTPQDLKNFKHLMVKTNALYQHNDPTTLRGRANKSKKWTKIQKTIWEEEKKKKGSGIVTGLLKRYQTNPRRVRRKLIVELLNLL